MKLCVMNPLNSKIARKIKANLWLLKVVCGEHIQEEIRHSGEGTSNRSTTPEENVLLVRWKVKTTLLLQAECFSVRSQHPCPGPQHMLMNQTSTGGS